MKKSVIFLLLLSAVCQKAWSDDIARGYVFEDTNRNGVMDRREKGIPGVAVSDGKTIVLTDESGYYELPAREHCVIFVIKPKGHISPVDENNLPQNYYIHKPDGSPEMKYAGSEPTGSLPEELNFPMLPYDDPEKFSFFAFGDPQPYSMQQLEFFRRAIVDEARERTEGISFGISLGDIVGDHLDLQKEYVKVIGEMGIPWYNVIGNHDRNLDGEKEMYANETFESNFGPSTYAFRYGDTHFIVLDDIYMHLAPKGNPYKGGFSEDQFEFMENYVRLVGEDELIVFAYHIPIAYKENQFIPEHRERFFRIFQGRTVFGMSAHTHIQIMFEIGEKYGWTGEEPYFEYNVGTSNGDWYSGKIDPETGLPDAMMRDGTPQGYAIVDIDGNDYSFRYKTAGRDEDYQMTVYGPRTVAAGGKGYPFYVNFFVGKSDDTVEFRIDGGEWKKMTRVTNEVDPVFANKVYEWDRTEVRFEGRRPSSLPVYSTHLWKGSLDCRLSPGEHRVEIIATDMFGNKHGSQYVYKINE